VRAWCGVPRAACTPRRVARCAHLAPGTCTALRTLHGCIGTWRELSRGGRVLDDGTSQVTETTYNTAGLVVSHTDPVGRQATYSCAVNGSDLLEVGQLSGTATDLLASYSGYTTQHQPQTVTGAAGQTTTFVYNAAGQVLTVTNAKPETTA